MSKEFITDQQCNRVWWVLAAKDALGGAWTYYQGGDVVDCVLGAAVTSVLCAMDVNGGNGFDWYKNINEVSTENLHYLIQIIVLILWAMITISL